MSISKKLLQAAAGNAGESLYVEDVFSTYLYDGSSSAQTITNGIDLDGEGGMVWIKERNTSGSDNHVSDTERGIKNPIQTDSTAAENSYYFDNNLGITSFNNNGFTVASGANFNDDGDTTVSWTFRKAEKFFDVVTYTGNGVAGRTVAHNLGSVPGMVIVKSTNANVNWEVYHKSLGNTHEIRLNQTTAALDDVTKWNDTTPTDSVFTVGTDNTVNRDGWTYVAYLFASDAGGFGDDGSESIIKCGSYVEAGSGLTNTVELGFEPQWVLLKETTNGTVNWTIQDTMRGMASDGRYIRLEPNTSAAEQNSTWSDGVIPTATGFVATNQFSGTAGLNVIYIAIRRPMKTPESGTEVFSVSDSMSGAVQPAFDAPHVVDMAFQRRPAFTQTTHIASRLTGTNNLYTDTTAAEVSQVENVWDFMDGWGGWSVTNTDYRAWNFKRATGFFDVVAYTGNSTSGRIVNHNLKVAPELIITKTRSGGYDRGWAVYHKDVYSDGDKSLFLNTSAAAIYDGVYYPSTPNSTSYTLGIDAHVNNSSNIYIAYLFATLAGVSKVGSYTGTGADLNVDCGFSAGARFILIKRTDSTGDWYVWDSVRGITAGNDPYLLLNTTAAEVTSTDYIDPLSSGFTVTSTAPAALNASGGSYIFLAIA